MTSHHKSDQCLLLCTAVRVLWDVPVVLFVMTHLAFFCFWLLLSWDSVYSSFLPCHWYDSAHLRRLGSFLPWNLPSILLHVAVCWPSELPESLLFSAYKDPRAASVPLTMTHQFIHGSVFIGSSNTFLVSYLVLLYVSKVVMSCFQNNIYLFICLFGGQGPSTEPWLFWNSLWY